MVAEPRQEVNLAGVVGTYRSGCMYGIWFNAGRAAPKDWSKRVYNPAWYDENDDRETFAWKKPAGLAPCEAEWNKADEVLPRFKLTAQHKVPTDQCERMKDNIPEAAHGREGTSSKESEKMIKFQITSQKVQQCKKIAPNNIELQCKGSIKQYGVPIMCFRTNYFEFWA